MYRLRKLFQCAPGCGYDKGKILISRGSFNTLNDAFKNAERYHKSMENVGCSCKVEVIETIG